MRRLLTGSTIGLASLVTIGVLSLQGGAAWANDDNAQNDPQNNLVKRDEDTPDVVLDDHNDDDDDDTDLNTSGQTNTNTNTDGLDTSGNTHEGGIDNTGDDTNSRVTSITRDRDRSRGDLTTDMTNDGRGRNNVDNSRNHTNDRSRHDTRR